LYCKGNLKMKGNARVEVLEWPPKRWGQGQVIGGGKKGHETEAASKGGGGLKKGEMVKVKRRGACEKQGKKSQLNAPRRRGKKQWCVIGSWRCRARRGQKKHVR